MCKAFSCLINRAKKVTWKFAVDSHEDLVKIAGYTDDNDDPTFARVEITPKNGNYLNPDTWVFRLDEERTPSWWSVSYENKCWDAHEKWLNQFNKILVRKAIVHPFKIKPPKKITDEHLNLLKEWVSIWDSVGDSIRDSVRDSIWDSVGDSVGDSVRDSNWDSVWAYTGSFFLLDRNAWKYTDNIQTDDYPFLSLVKLWEQGLVPSFDGNTWRLHGGKGAKVLWEGEL